MEGTVINKTSSTALQVYMEHTTSRTNVKPVLKGYQGGSIPVVGTSAPADVSIQGTGPNVYVGLWGPDATEGLPNSWFIFEVGSGKIISSHFRKYAGTVKGNKTDGWIVTIVDHSESEKKLLIVLAIVLAVIIVLGIGIGIFIFLRHRPTTSKPKTVTTADPFSQSDSPIFKPQY